MAKRNLRYFCTSILLAVVVFLHPTVDAAGTGEDDGERVYRYYCYQCHAYSGDAKTQASSYVDPPPRDFTAAESAQLTTERMVASVAGGRPGTAMPAFSSVLGDDEIAAVVTYVRERFMTNEREPMSYHSAANGWLDHERYDLAYAFVAGDVSVGAAAEHLTPDQIRGRQLYLEACISCHEQPGVRYDDTVWEPRAVSYPRRHFDHRAPAVDLVSEASPYARHDTPVVPQSTTPAIEKGMQLFQQNCAFCHAADGTGKNWIGSFLEPRPRDFTAADDELMQDATRLRTVIQNGLSGRSMPAWRNVLSDAEIDAIIAYMQAAFVR